jgi:hypothetical protein
MYYDVVYVVVLQSATTFNISKLQQVVIMLSCNLLPHIVVRLSCKGLPYVVMLKSVIRLSCKGLPYYSVVMLKSVTTCVCNVSLEMTTTFTI